MIFCRTLKGNITRAGENILKATGLRFSLYDLAKGEFLQSARIDNHTKRLYSAELQSHVRLIL